MAVHFHLRGVKSSFLTLIDTFSCYYKATFFLPVCLQMNYLWSSVINCWKCFHCCVVYYNQVHSSFTHMSHFRRLACKMARIALRVHGNYFIPRELSILCLDKFEVLCAYRSLNWEMFSVNLCAFIFHYQNFYFSSSLSSQSVHKFSKLKHILLFFYNLIEPNCRFINFDSNNIVFR